MLQRLLRPADLQAFLGESAAVGDGVDDLELVSQRAVSAGRDRARRRPTGGRSAPRRNRTTPGQLEGDINERADPRQKQNDEPQGMKRPVLTAWTMRRTSRT